MGLSVFLFGLPGAAANHGEGESARDKAENSPDASRNDRAWAPGQATGPPNTGEAGDFPTAWASATPDGQDEWLDLRYASPIRATTITVCETYNPGALEAVSVFKPGGEEVKVWTGKPTPTGGGPQPTTAPPTQIPGDVCDIASSKVPTQIINDAVANPGNYYGYDLACNPNLPLSVVNPLRRMLSMNQPNKPFHPLFNSVEWKCGCP